MKPADNPNTITPKIQGEHYESPMSTDESSPTRHGDNISVGSLESATFDLHGENPVSFENSFSVQSSDLNKGTLGRQIKPSGSLGQRGAGDQTGISYGLHNGPSGENNITIMYSCKHNFPFKTIKSYPKVYYSDVRGHQKKTKYTEIKNSDTDKCASSVLLSKHELLKKLDETDGAIGETEKKIETLKKGLGEYPLEKNTKTNSATSVSICERIYSENKAKAEASHRLLSNANKNISDLSNVQPNEMENLLENCKRFELLRPCLVESISERRQREVRAGKAAKEVFEVRRSEWKSWIGSRESSPERRRIEVERLQFFEKVFPELRIDREHKEIFKSASVRTRNQPYVRDYDLFLREKQTVKENARMLAAKIPQLLTAPETVREAVKNENLMRNQEIYFNQERPANVHWNQREKEIFKEKFLEYPKNFAAISSHFKDKSVPECIEHYYLTKKEENYRELLSLKDSRRTRGCRSERCRTEYLETNTSDNPENSHETD